MEEHFYTPLLPSLSLQVQFLKLFKVTGARFSCFFSLAAEGDKQVQTVPLPSLHSRFSPLYLLASFVEPFRLRNSKYYCVIIPYFFPFEEPLLLPFPPMTHIPLPPSILTDFPPPPVLSHTLRLACKCIFKGM